MSEMRYRVRWLQTCDGDTYVHLREHTDEIIRLLRQDVEHAKSDGEQDAKDAFEQAIQRVKQAYRGEYTE